MAGSRVGFVWIYGLIVLFATGVIELVIMPAIEYKLVPSLVASMNQTSRSLGSATPDADVLWYTTQVTNTIGFMHAAMYVVMLVIFVYLVLSIFKREENEYYQP